MKRRTWLIALIVGILLVPAGGIVLADCSGDGTTNVNCTGNDEQDGADGTGGNDTVTVQENATVADDSNDNAVNTGGGNDTVTIDGTVENTRTNGGDVNTGTGNDTIVVSEDGVVEGDIKPGNDDDTVTVAGEVNGNVGDFNSGRGNDDITIEEGATVGGNVVGGNDTDTIVVEADATVNGNVQGGTGNDDITIDSDATVNGEIRAGSGGETTGDTLTFVVRNTSDRDTVENAPTSNATNTITFSSGNSFRYNQFENLLAVLIQIANGNGNKGDSDDEEEVLVTSAPLVLFDDRENLVVFIADGGLDFYRYDTPETLNGIGIGFVPFEDISSAPPATTILDDTDEEGFQLVVSVPEVGTLQFELFTGSTETPSLGQTAGGSLPQTGGNQVVNALVDFQ